VPYRLPSRQVLLVYCSFKDLTGRVTLENYFETERDYGQGYGVCKVEYASSLIYDGIWMCSSPCRCKSGAYINKVDSLKLHVCSSSLHLTFVKRVKIGIEVYDDFHATVHVISGRHDSRSNVRDIGYTVSTAIVNGHPQLLWRETFAVIRFLSERRQTLSKENYTRERIKEKKGQGHRYSLAR